MSKQWQRWKNIMKAVPFEEKRLSKWAPPYIVQPKYDGIRCRAVPLENGQYILLSSEENVVFSVPHINETLGKIGVAAELDGELYAHGMDFGEVLSITSRTVNIHPNCEKIQFHVFDIVNELPQMKRTILIENLRDRSRYIQIAPFWLCEDLQEIMTVFERLVSNGYEGIIVRHSDAPYERKRSTFVMKFKPKKSDTYKIVGFEEENSNDGVPKACLGSLICESGDGERFSVGTGFSDSDRAELWDVRALLPGTHVKIEYQHITPGRKVPRFPVFSKILWKESGEL